MRLRGWWPYDDGCFGVVVGCLVAVGAAIGLVLGL